MSDYKANGKVYRLTRVEVGHAQLNACDGCAFEGKGRECDDAPLCFEFDDATHIGVFKEVAGE